MTTRGLAGSSLERSLAARRATKDGLTAPAPVPAKSGVVSVPTRSRVPPKPYGDKGASSSSPATRSGWSIGEVHRHPGTHRVRHDDRPGSRFEERLAARSAASSSAATSSAKSRRPRVASTGAGSLPPYPRRSGATTRHEPVGSSRRTNGSQYPPDEQLPWISSTGVPPSGPHTCTCWLMPFAFTVMLMADPLTTRMRTGPEQGGAVARAARPVRPARPGRSTPPG